MGEGNSLINLGDLSKPVDTLISKISDAIGVLYEPTRIVRKAKAEAEADEIKTLQELKISDIQKRAMHRVLMEETKKQENIENIIEKTLPLVKETSKTEEIQNDWIADFFEKARIVSDEDMQQIWSKLLAEEANKQGSISKKTLKIVSELDKKDAILFSSLCSFCFMIGLPTIVVFDVENELYNSSGIHFTSLKHLDSLGLISFDNIAGYVRKQLPNEFIISYFRTLIKVKFPTNENNDLTFGKVLLTQTGLELVRICEAIKKDDVLEYTIRQWESHGIKCDKIGI